MLLLIIISVIVGAAVAFWFARSEPDPPLLIVSLVFMFSSAVGWMIALMLPFVVGGYCIKELAKRYPKTPDEPAT